MRFSLHTLRDSCRVLERRHGLAEIIERRTVGLAERPRVAPPHSEDYVIVLSEDALRHGYLSAHQRLDFFEASCLEKGIRVVAGC